MNICFVYKNYPIDENYDSGIGKYLHDLACELKKDHNIIIITTSKSPRVISSKNITVHAIPYPYSKKRSISFIRHLLNVSVCLIKIIWKYDIDIIEFANWEAEGLFFSLFPNKLLQVPITIKLYTPSFIDNKYNSEKRYFSVRLKEMFEKIFVNQKGNHLITSTKYNARKCQKVYNIKNKHIEIIPLSENIKNLNSTGNNNKQLTVLYVGRLEKRKGIDILIKSIPKVLLKVKNTRFLIVGRENNNYDWVNKLRNSIDYKYLDRVNFLGYIKDPATIDKLYRNSDICVVPSRYESFGLTVLQALSYGKAVVASDSGGIPEVIDNNKNGLLFKNNDPDSLTSCLIKLLTNKKLRTKLGNSALKSVKKDFNKTKLSKQNVKYYQFLLAGNGK